MSSIVSVRWVSIAGENTNPFFFCWGIFHTSSIPTTFIIMPNKQSRCSCRQNPIMNTWILSVKWTLKSQHLYNFTQGCPHSPAYVEWDMIQSIHLMTELNHYKEFVYHFKYLTILWCCCTSVSRRFIQETYEVLFWFPEASNLVCNFWICLRSDALLHFTSPLHVLPASY